MASISYSTYLVLKASVIKRFNCTLKNNMWNMFTLNGNGSNCYHVSNYNTHKHRTINMRSVDITPVIAKRFLATVYNHVKVAGLAKFKVGDPVCMNKYKTVFEKITRQIESLRCLRSLKYSVPIP